MIRIATANDAEKLLTIYAHYVENTAVTFEYAVPTVDEFRKRIETTLEKYPFLVSEVDGEIVGYAYAGTFKARSAFDWAVETSIYIEGDSRRRGLGKELYAALEKALALQNILNLNACIGYPLREDAYLTKDSVFFHERLGYRFVGEFHKCGYKFGQWYDVVWMEKCLAKHPDKPLPVLRFEEVRQELFNQYGIR